MTVLMPDLCVLERFKDDGRQTLGWLSVYDRHHLAARFATLEPAWLGNRQRVSAVPVGHYCLKKRTSPKYGRHFHVLDLDETEVDGRSLILIHAGNYRRDTLGCILVGEEHADLNRDGSEDVRSSAVSMRKLLALLPDESNLLIVSEV